MKVDQGRRAHSALVTEAGKLGIIILTRCAGCFNFPAANAR
jgi:hypothetical protein